MSQPKTAAEIKKLIETVMTGKGLEPLIALSILKVEWQRQVKQ